MNIFYVFFTQKIEKLSPLINWYFALLFNTIFRFNKYIINIVYTSIFKLFLSSFFFFLSYISSHPYN